MRICFILHDAKCIILELEQFGNNFKTDGSGHGCGLCNHNEVIHEDIVVNRIKNVGACNNFVSFKRNHDISFVLNLAFLGQQFVMLLMIL